MRVMVLTQSYRAYHQHDLSWVAGPPEQGIEEEWQKLQEHPDILAAAPDDEVLAELLAVQVSLYRCHHRHNSPYPCIAQSLCCHGHCTPTHVPAYCCVVQQHTCLLELQTSI